MTTTNETNLTFGNVRARTDGSAPDFTPRRPEGPVSEDHFDAFYRVVRPTAEHADTLVSASCIIGSPTRVILEDEPHLESSTGDYIGPLLLEDVSRLVEAQGKGWSIACYVDYIAFNATDKTLWAEFAFFMWDPEYPALETYVGNQLKRICRGDHPRIALNQEDFQRVLESRGQWNLTKEAPLPECRHGEATFKKRRDPADWLVAASNKHRSGCLVLSILFWVVLAAAIVLLIIF